MSQRTFKLTSALIREIHLGSLARFRVDMFTRNAGNLIKSFLITKMCKIVGGANALINQLLWQLW